MGAWSEQVKLTEKVVSEAQPAEIRGEARGKLFLDTQRTGFGLAVSAKGAKSYFVMRRVKGKQVRFVFGKAGELPLAHARREAEQLLAQMFQGVDPVQQRRAAREAAAKEEVRGVTLEQALRLCKGTMKAKRRSQRTIDDYDRNVRKYLADWLARPLASITRTETREKHQGIAAAIRKGAYAAKPKQRKGPVPGGEYGETTANAVMRTFRAVYNRALREHPELPACPTINVDWFKEERRRTVVAAGTMADWYQRVQALPNPIRRDYHVFTLFTGLRRTDVCTMRWEHVDWKERSLHVPMPKGGHAFSLPLTDFVVGLLEHRRAENERLFEGSPWVFPSLSDSGHIEEPREDALGSTIHDLRRTFITVAESLDLSPYAIKLLVNHALPKADVTGGYVVPDLERLRRPMQLITDRLLALTKARGEPAAANDAAAPTAADSDQEAA